jgi:hypothetical protein
MKKTIFISLLFIGLTSFGIHKFFVSIYQINYNQKAKRIEITARIFVDDLNSILYKKYKQKTHLGEANETAEDVGLMKKYLAEKLLIKVNNQITIIQFVSKEMEGNTLISYYKIENIGKIKTLEIKNTTLFDLSSDQQNIFQTTIYGKKESQLLTVDNVIYLLKVE